MPYAGQTWTDGLTPLDAAHMNALDAGVVGSVDVDNVVAAASVIVANKLAGGDAQPAFRILGDGTHGWGAGGATAPDTNLYRAAANQLKTDDDFYAANLLSNGGVFSTGVVNANAGSPQQISLHTSGGIFFHTALDTNLYRSVAGVLKTDGSLRTVGSVQVNQGTGQDVLIGSGVSGTFRGISFINDAQSAWDTNLYRSVASVLKTDGVLQAGLEIQARVGGAEQVRIGSVSGNAGVLFGSAFDTNLYRSAAGVLKTDGSLSIGGVLRIGVAAAAGVGLPTVAPKRVEVFNDAGVSQGFIPVYANV